MSQLTNLDVDRVDAVDHPANQTRFLVLKSVDQLPAFQVDDQDELLANAQQLAQKAQRLVGYLANGWVAKSDSEAQVANELAKLLGYDDLKFVAKSASDSEDETEDEEPEVPAGSTSNVERFLRQLVKQDRHRSEAIERLPLEICKAMAEHFGESEPEAPRAPARSSQLPETEEVRKSSVPRFGDGMFSNIVSAPTTTLGG